MSENDKRYRMTRRQAAALFGNTRALARALECTPQNIYAWGGIDDQIDNNNVRRVIGAAVLEGLLTPAMASQFKARQTVPGRRVVIR